MEIKENKLKIRLPSEMLIHIPTLSDVPLEDMARLFSTKGVEMIQKEIESRVLEAFVNEHEEYIKTQVARLIDEKRGEIKKLLNS